MRCPACHDEMLEGEPVAACRDRHVLLHADCRELVRGFCPTTGCGSRLLDQGTFSVSQDKDSDRIQMTAESVARANRPANPLREALDSFGRMTPAGAPFVARPIDEVGAELRDRSVGWIQRNTAIAATLLIGLLGCGVIGVLSQDPNYWPVGTQIQHAIKTGDGTRLRRIAASDDEHRQSALVGLMELARHGRLRRVEDYLDSRDPRLVEIGIRALNRRWEPGVPQAQVGRLLQIYGQFDDAGVEAAAIELMDRYSRSTRRAFVESLGNDDRAAIAGFRKRLGDGRGEVFAFLLETLSEADKSVAEKIQALILELPEQGLPALFEALGSGHPHVRELAYAELKRRRLEVTAERLATALRPDQELHRRSRALVLLSAMTHLPDFVVPELVKGFGTRSRALRASATDAARRLADDDVILGRLLAIAAQERSRDAIMTGKALRVLAPRIEDQLVRQAITDKSDGARFAAKLLLWRPTGRHALIQATLAAEGEARTRGLNIAIVDPKTRKTLFEMAKARGQIDRLRLEVTAVLPPTTRSVDLLVEFYLSGSKAVAERALKRIAEINPARGEFELANAIPRSRETDLKRRALAGIVALGFKNGMAVGPVKGLVFDFELGRQAAEALGRQGPAGRAALVSIIHQNTAEKRGEARLAKHCKAMVVHGLKAAGPEGEEALARLLGGASSAGHSLLGALGRDSKRGEAVDRQLVELALAGGTRSAQAIHVLVTNPTQKSVELLLEPVVDKVPNRSARAAGILSRIRGERLAPCLLKLTIDSPVKDEAERRLEALLAANHRSFSLAFALLHGLEGADRATGESLARRLKRHEMGARVLSHGRSQSFAPSAGMVACLLELDGEETRHRFARELAAMLATVQGPGRRSRHRNTWRERGEALVKVLAADPELATPVIDRLLADSALRKSKAAFPGSQAYGVSRVLEPRSRSELERWREPLLDAIDSEDRYVAQHLAPIAARFGQAACLRITAALRGKTRVAALEAAAALDPAPPLDMLPRLLEGLESNEPREAGPASMAVARIVKVHLGGAGELAAARSLRELVRAAGCMPQRGGLERVVEALEAAGVAASPGRLFDLAADPLAEVRIGVARAIGSLAAERPQARRILEGLVKDKDPKVRSAAAGALHRLRR